jgi:hypothetical protein
MPTRASPAIPLVHAGLAATIYILLREHFPLPWLWPLDDGVWPAAAILILAGWACVARRQNPLARGAIIGVGAAIVLAAILGAVFAVALDRWMPRLDRLPASLALFYGIGLAAWIFMAFLASVAMLAGGLIAGAIAEWSGVAGRTMAIVFAICGLVVPLAATWSHAVLGLGLVDLDRCRERLEDSLTLRDAILAPRVIVVGIRADCWGQPVRGGFDSK